MVYYELKKWGWDLRMMRNELKIVGREEGMVGGVYNMSCWNQENVDVGISKIFVRIVRKLVVKIQIVGRRRYLYK